MAADEFIEWATGLPDGEHYGLVGGQLVGVPPTTVAHVRVRGRVCGAMGDAVRRAGLPCEVLLRGLAVQTDADTVYEPDVLVRCGERLPDDAVKVVDPMIIAEVVSSSSGGRDKGARLADYVRLRSLRHYLILDIKRRSVTDHR